MQKVGEKILLWAVLCVNLISNISTLFEQFNSWWQSYPLALYISSCVLVVCCIIYIFKARKEVKLQHGILLPNGEKKSSTTPKFTQGEKKLSIVLLLIIVCFPLIRNVINSYYDRLNNEKIIIGIADFYSEDDLNKDESVMRKFIGDFKDTVEHYSHNKIYIKKLNYISQQNNPLENAKKQGKKNNALLVIYGDIGKAEDRLWARIIVAISKKEISKKANLKNEIISKYHAKAQDFIIEMQLAKNISEITLMILGITEYLNGNYIQAKYFVDKVPDELNNKFNESAKKGICFHKGLIYQSLGSIDSMKRSEYYLEAIKYYDLSISVDSDNEPSFINKAVIYEQEGKYSKAKEVLLEAENKLSERGKVKTILKDIEPYVLFEKGIEVYHSQEYARAIRLFNESISLLPTIKALNLRGICHYRTNSLSKARQDFNAALKLDSTFSITYNNIGVVQANEGKLSDAIQTFNKALVLDTMSKEALFNRGLIKTKLKENLSAIKDYNRLLAIDSLDANAYFFRGISRNQLGLKEKAMLDFETAIAINPEDAKNNINLSLALLDMNNYSESKHYLRQAFISSSEYSCKYYLKHSQLINEFIRQLIEKNCDKYAKEIY